VQTELSEPLPESFTYQVFDLALRCNFRLSAIPETHTDRVDLIVHLHPGAAFDEEEFEQFHDWRTPNGAIAISGLKRDGEYLLKFPGLADFHLSPGNSEIQIFPQAASSGSTLSHLLLDQVIPRFMNQLERLVIHASAVVLPGGEVLAFLGNTGKGKSTLASSFFASGARLLSDDCLMLERRGEQVFCRPAYPSLRLWADSMEALFPGKEESPFMAHYSKKRQMILDQSKDESGQPIRLSALFILEDLDEDDVRTLEASGMHAAMSIIESTFALDLASRKVVQHNFERVAELMASDLPLFRLQYKRDFSMLPEVRQKVEDSVKGLDSGG
jgi:hypothetical protein